MRESLQRFFFGGGLWRSKSLKNAGYVPSSPPYRQSLYMAWMGTDVGILLSVPVGDRTLGTATVATLHAILLRATSQGRAQIIWNDSVSAFVQERPAASVGDCGQILFETQLPDFGYSAVLQVYRQSVDAPPHAVGGEIWRGTLKEADITPIHCTSLTARQVEIYLERLLLKIQEAYGRAQICKFGRITPPVLPLIRMLGEKLMRQLELPLWETLQEAASVPEDADLPQLWLSLDATIAPLSTRQQLQVAGDAITQITQIVQQRSLLTLEEIDSFMQDEGPVVAADFFDKFVRQSMHVDFGQFVEPPPPLPRQLSQRSRREFPNDGRSVVGLLDKAALLEAINLEPEFGNEVTSAQALAVAPERRCFCLGGRNLEIFPKEASTVCAFCRVGTGGAVSDCSGSG